MPNNLQKSVKNRFSNNKYTCTVFVGRGWIVIRYFIIRKLAFNGLLKVIGMQLISELGSELLSYL